eukprot:CAMPEP_0197865062 /NCGR_PEP_ID=MMETSP1438-20131217/43448_1 /TAXON_ID=1461541 /ORGANISM="Pterosperma sp., Strain CCMP1384" /LENGTH=88 /DNA_ID=CAMNT_0043483471 /DNA_START=445 /DNA_END=712 /DNA_ORIENTATION=+
MIPSIIEEEQQLQRLQQKISNCNNTSSNTFRVPAALSSTALSAAGAAVGEALAAVGAAGASVGAAGASVGAATGWAASVGAAIGWATG